MPPRKEKGGNGANPKAKPHGETKLAVKESDYYDKTSNTDYNGRATSGDFASKRPGVSDMPSPTIDLKAIRDIFRFLDLPAEIRNQIYRILLVVHRVTYVPNPSYYDSPSESQPTGSYDIGLMSAPIGTVRCHTPRINNMKFYVSILRVNRQIHREASVVFHVENTWISVHVNKAGVGQMLKDHGFAAMRCGRISRPCISSTSVAVIFPSLLECGEIDSFVMTITGIFGLIRALWTMKGMEEMYVIIEIHSYLAGDPWNESDLIGPFLRLRGISKAIVSGAHMKRWNTYLPYLMRQIHSSDEEILQDLNTIAQQAYTKRNKKNYREAEISFEEVLSHLADCFKVYGPSLLGYPDTSLPDEIVPLVINIALDLAEVKNKLGHFHHAIKYSNYAMAIIPIDDVTTAPILLARGLAYAGLKQNISALRDLLSAKEMDPQNTDISLEMTKFKKSLHPDPAEALKAFKTLRLTIKKEEEEELQADLAQTQDLSGGIVVATRNPDGTVTIEHRF